MLEGVLVLGSIWGLEFWIFLLLSVVDLNELFGGLGVLCNVWFWFNDWVIFVFFLFCDW